MLLKLVRKCLLGKFYSLQNYSPYSLLTYSMGVSFTSTAS